MLRVDRRPVRGHIEQILAKGAYRAVCHCVLKFLEFGVRRCRDDCGAPGPSESRHSRELAVEVATLK